MNFKPFNAEASKMKKVEALYLRATTEGEREAARRILLKLRQKYAPIKEYQRQDIRPYTFTVFKKV